MQRTELSVHEEDERGLMGIQYAEAPAGTEYQPTYKGRFLKERFQRDPELKRKVSKRWLSEGYVQLIKTEEEITEHDNNTAVYV